MHQELQKLIHLTKSGNLGLSYSPFQTCDSLVMLYWLQIMTQGYMKFLT